MKKRIVSFYIILVISIFAGNANANPVATVFFTELSFNSNGWVIEMTDSMMPIDTLSYFISGNDTAYLKENFFRNEWGLIVFTRDSVIGNLNINPAGGIIYFCIAGRFGDELKFGNSETNPPLTLGQSLCRFNSYQFYLDNSPTIGLPNDSIDATGSVFGYVKDILNNPVGNTKVVYLYHGEALFIPDKYVTTDSTGYFFIPSIFAKNSSIGVQSDFTPYDYKFVKVSVQPSCIYQADINLDWIVSGTAENPNSLNYKLSQNYPNPFNPNTIISFSLPNDEFAEIKIYDVLGNEVTTLLNDFIYAGEHKLEFNGSRFASGNYFYRLIAGNHIETKKLVLVK